MDACTPSLFKSSKSNNSSPDPADSPIASDIPIGNHNNSLFGLHGSRSMGQPRSQNAGKVGKKISLEGSRITIPEIKAAFLARSGDEDLTAGIRWSGGKDAIIQACLLSLGPNLDPMDVDQVASSSAAAPLAAPPPPSSQQRAAIDRRVCASASAGGKPGAIAFQKLQEGIRNESNCLVNNF